MVHSWSKLESLWETNSVSRPIQGHLIFVHFGLSSREKYFYQSSYLSMI